MVGSRGVEDINLQHCADSDNRRAGTCTQSIVVSQLCLHLLVQKKSKKLQ